MIFPYLFDIVVLCVRVALVLSRGHGATEPLIDTKHLLILKTHNITTNNTLIDAVDHSSSRGRLTPQRAIQRGEKPNLIKLYIIIRRTKN